MGKSIGAEDRCNRQTVISFSDPPDTAQRVSALVLNSNPSLSDRDGRVAYLYFCLSSNSRVPRAPAATTIPFVLKTLFPLFKK